MTKCKLISENDSIAVVTPYDPDFVYEIKRHIPATDRRYDPKTKRWLVTSQHGKRLQDILLDVFNENVPLPVIKTTKSTVTQKILDVRYIGATKDRGGDDRSAYGWHADGWNVIFPETVLRSWFDAPTYPDEQPNLYSVLGCKRDVTESELKTAYHRMAMEWHPDHSREPNAHEQFLAVQHAYDVLSKNRERYDAGLALEASLRNTPKSSTQYSVSNGYRTPLRCGLIMVEGIEKMRIFHVSKIYAWQDVKDSYGRILISSWPAGSDTFEERWV